MERRETRKEAKNTRKKFEKRREERSDSPLGICSVLRREGEERERREKRRRTRRKESWKEETKSGVILFSELIPFPEEKERRGKDEKRGEEHGKKVGKRRREEQSCMLSGERES